MGVYAINIVPKHEIIHWQNVVFKAECEILKETDKNKMKNLVGSHYNGKIFTRKEQKIYSLILTSKERLLFSKLNCILT